MLASCRVSTHKQYQSSWKVWDSWCRERSLNTLSAPLTDIHEFLVTCEKKGLSYRTLGVYRSAISRYHDPVGGIPVGRCEAVVQLMKGFFNRNPPKPKYMVTWDVESVLVLLSQLGSWSSLSVRMLTLKMVLLLALVTAGRVSSLVHLNINHLVVTPHSLKFVPCQLLKQSRLGHTMRVVEIKAFEDKSICPVQAVSCYRDHTAAVRGTETQLLLSYLKPDGKVVSSTVSRWIVALLQSAGVDTQKFKAHSTRGAATSASFRLGVSMKDIVESADKI